MIKNKDILLVSTMAYNALPTRKQRIAKELSENNRVLYLEPPITYFGKWFKKAKQEPVEQNSSNPNLIIKQAPTILPFGLNNRIIQETNQKTVVKAITKTMSEYQFKADIIWFYLVDFPGIANINISATIVYDCVDDHSSYGGLRNPSFVNELEKELVEKSDLVFVTTNHLAEKIKSFGGLPMVVPNGVDFKLYESWDGKKPSELENENRPIIGYLGALKSWFDVEFVKKIASAYPHCCIVLAGPCTDEFKTLFEKDTNVILPGSIPYSDTPAWIGSFSVALIPFLPNDLTLHISPLKFFEYCALGKPCVTIPIEQLKQYENVTYFYQNHEQGLKRIQDALNENDSKIEKRIQIAKEASWEDKFTVMFEEVQRFLLSNMYLD